MKKLLILLIFASCLILYSFHTAHAAITFDASVSKTANAVNTVTSSITVGSGSNELLVITLKTGGTASPSGVTVDGSAATFAIKRTATADNEIYYFLNLSAGSHTVSTTYAISINGGMSVSSYFGVNQSTPLDVVASSTATSVTPTSTITTTVANDLIVDNAGFPGTATTTANGASQNVIVANGGNATQEFSSSYSTTTTAGAYNTHWTLSSSKTWQYVQAAFEPAPASVSSVAPYCIVTDE